MRKSAAPSSKISSSGQPSRQFVSWPKTTPIHKHNSEISTTKVQNVLIPAPVSSNTPPGAARSISTLLALLSETSSKENSSPKVPSIHVTEKKNVPIPHQEENCPIEVKNCHSEGEEHVKKNFTVVWGKPTTKKHKTWEGDGTLEVEGTNATLKDETGKILGRATKIKPSELEEGKRLKVGSKEVELIDVLSMTPTAKRPLQEAAPSGIVSKKPKLGSNSLGGLTRKVNPGSSPLHMPAPSSFHQWQFNSAKLPVVPVVVDGFLSNVLRQHQRIGVSFLYECVTGLRNLSQRGAILADEMGLGKTLQCITLIWTMLKQGPYGGRPLARRILIVCPSSLVKNWENEFERWLGRYRLQTFAVDQKNRPSEFVRRSHIPVMIISYEMLVRQIEEMRKIKFDLLVCDEGHRLKNSNIRASLLLNELEIKARIVLTGTPIQNDLKEFFALIDFVNPGSLSSNTEFRKYFEEPIVAMQQPDADEDVVDVGKKRAEQLNIKTKGFILRRTQAVIDRYLPKKTETVLFIKPSRLQSTLYYSALAWWADHESLSGTGENGVHFAVMMNLRKLCNHPSIAVSQSTKSDNDGSSSAEQSELVSRLHAQYDRLAGSAQGTAPDQSGKVQAIRGIVQSVSKLGEKIVLVSYFTQMLDLLAALCQELGLTFCRLDGSTPAAQRMTIIEKFNSRYGQSVFLLSARAGGVGLNLTGASRLVLVDSDWNPANDLQAMSRVWRDGQRKDVYIYRLLTCGTIEEKVFQRQISKSGLSGSIINPNSSGGVRLSKAELKDLFTPNIGDRSLTHDSLECPCRGFGTIPDVPLNEETGESRDCQISLVSESSAPSKKLSMNQLMLWQHHAPPFNSDFLKELALTSVAENFVFIFSNPSTPTSSQSIDLIDLSP